MIVCGEDLLVKTFWLAGQAASGKESHKPSHKFELGLVGRDRRARRILDRAVRTARRSVPTIHEMASISLVSAGR